MKEPIVSVSGVRGIYGESLTLPSASLFALGFAQYCREKSKSDKIIIGRDGRLKGEEITAVVASTLALSGFEVIDIGIVPTPTVQIATEHEKAAGGISVTASHNPQEWNGLKFLNPDGTFLDGDEIKKVKLFSDEKKFGHLNLFKYRNVKSDYSWTEKHIKMALGLKGIDLKKIRSRKFKIVVDAVNASGSEIIPQLLKKLGCSVIELFCDNSGKFPHLPEPLPQNLKQLSKAVKKNKADLGIAVDPDTDRLVIITESGEPFIEENTIVTVVKSVLKTTKRKIKKVVVNMSTTRGVDDICKTYGAKVFRSPVGEINVVKEMKKQNAIVGGEGSGGVIIPELHYGRDALAGIPHMLSEFASFEGKVSNYKKSLPSYFIIKNKIEIKSSPDKVIGAILNKYKNSNCRIQVTDGLKLDFPDYWIHLRKSNTEPIIRIITEARTEKAAIKIQNDFIKEVQKLLT